MLHAPIVSYASSFNKEEKRKEKKIWQRTRAISVDAGDMRRRRKEPKA